MQEQDPSPPQQAEPVRLTLTLPFALTLAQPRTRRQEGRIQVRCMTNQPSCAVTAASAQGAGPYRPAATKSTCTSKQYVLYCARACYAALINTSSPIGIFSDVLTDPGCCLPCSAGRGARPAETEAEAWDAVEQGALFLRKDFAKPHCKHQRVVTSGNLCLSV